MTTDSKESIQLPKQKWKVRKASDENLKPFVLKHGELLGKVLWARGFETPTSDDLGTFLDPKLKDIQSPSLMLNMDSSVDRIFEAISKKEALCIYSDYDMDGMAGLSLLFSFLEKCGVENISHFQPHRFDDGYGLHPEALQKLFDQGNKLVITVDTGTTAVEAVEHANKIGLDVIITDHHAQKEVLPNTQWLINPNQTGDTSDLGYLSGTGVAFYACMALRQKLRESGYFKNIPEPDLREWLDLFCLGTVGDVVDLKGDNRPLIRTGLQYLVNTHRPGLKALLENTLSSDRIAHINTRDLAFSVIPKLNAASRMGQAQLSTELLLTSLRDKGDELVEKIIELNTLRSTTQDEIHKEAMVQALAQSDANVLVLKGEWHEGVLGIVAAKLVEEFSKPSIVLAELNEDGKSELRGSMRTPAAFSCLNLLNTTEDLLGRFGGHQAAAGMQLDGKNFITFQKRLHDSFEELYLNKDEAPSIELNYDAELDLSSPLRIKDVSDLSKAEPYGAGNPEPTFMVKNYPIDSFSILKERHIKSKRSITGPDLIGFNIAQQWQGYVNSGESTIDLLVVPELNVFRGNAKAQLRIQAMQKSQP